MKLTSVELHPANSAERVVLSFRDPRVQNPYNVKAIVGLDADTIVPRFYKGSGYSDFHHMTLENREIVVRVGLNPQFGEYKTYSDLRDALYRAIASARSGKLQLQFKDGESVVAAISGHIIKLEAPLFEKTQEVQLTVSCDEPMLQAPDPIYLLPIVGEESLTLTIDDAKSTAPHGFTCEILVKEDTSAFNIQDASDESVTFAIVPPTTFLAGDVIQMSSLYNDKSLVLTRATVSSHIANQIFPNSVWPIIFPGHNQFILNPGDGELEWGYVTYYPTYWGV